MQPGLVGQPLAAGGPAYTRDDILSVRVVMVRGLIPNAYVQLKLVTNRDQATKTAACQLKLLIISSSGIQ